MRTDRVVSLGRRPVPFVRRRAADPDRTVPGPGGRGRGRPGGRAGGRPARVGPGPGERRPGDRRRGAVPAGGRPEQPVGVPGRADDRPRRAPGGASKLVVASQFAPESGPAWEVTVVALKKPASEADFARRNDGTRQTIADRPVVLTPRHGYVANPVPGWPGRTSRRTGRTSAGGRGSRPGGPGRAVRVPQAGGRPGRCDHPRGAGGRHRRHVRPGAAEGRAGEGRRPEGQGPGGGRPGAAVRRAEGGDAGGPGDRQADRRAAARLRPHGRPRSSTSASRWSWRPWPARGWWRTR